MLQQRSCLILLQQRSRRSLRECPIPTRPPPALPPNYKSQFNEHHFLLSKLKSGKFIGTHMKGKLPRQLWVPKALVTHVKGPKLAWVLKQK